MKRKVLLFAVTGMMVLSIFACGKKEEPKKETEQATEVVVTKRDLPEGNYEEKGEGTVYLSCEGGTTEDGNVPVIYSKKDTILMQVGLNAWDFNGGALSYVYIDGMLATKEQLANSQISLDLQGDSLTTGTHKVEVVQYTNDDTASEMITYRSFSYEIKEG